MNSDKLESLMKEADELLAKPMNFWLLQSGSFPRSSVGMQPGTLQRPISSRPGVNPDQPRLAEVIPRTRIPPVLGDVHVSPLHRVPVDIVQLFPHHRLAEDHLRMGAFLPELVFPVSLVRPFRESQASQQPLTPPAAR